MHRRESLLAEKNIQEGINVGKKERESRWRQSGKQNQENEIRESQEVIN